MVSKLRDTGGSVFISADINGENFFEQFHYSATYQIYRFGKSILLNQKGFPSASKEIINAQIFSLLIVESRALYTSDFLIGYTNSEKEYSIGGYTNAPDKLDEKVGIDKALYLSTISDKWFEQKKINKDEKK